MTASAAADLSVDQKVALLAGADTWHTAGFDDPSVPAIRMSDGPAGVRGTSWTGAPSASFPCGTALGATWDPELVERVGRALGREARAKSAHVLLAPTVNLQRTPISGRNFEFPSEDPVLAAEFAVAYVAGVQHEGVACCIKHFVGNETEFERMTVSSEIDERTLRELYFVPFEAAVRRAGVRAVMSAYNRLNGTHCADHRWLLTDVLRGEWGFDGAVISDWFGCHSAATSLLAGLDLEMPGPPIERGPRLRDALGAGEIAEEDLDRAVERLLALGRWTGAADTGTAEVTAEDDETRAVILEAAIRGTVLLKNEDATLPLGASGRVALIGPYSRFGRVQGGGSARVTPNRGLGPLAALVERGLDVTHEPGGAIAKYLPTLRGDFTVAYTDDGGADVAVPANRLSWFWDGAPAPGVAAGSFGARISGAFTPDSTGPWEIGVRAVGPVTVSLDGEAVVALEEAQTGGAFFGMGSAEVRATIDLEAGRRYDLTVDYPTFPDARVRGLAIGARAMPAGDHIERAAAMAAAADVAVVVVGTDEDWETEGEDRASMILPGDQDALVAAVLAANPNTVVVVNTGSPVLMPWLDDAPAVLQLWFPGQEIGTALADVLLGTAEPGGRLPITFPARIEDTPAFAHYPGGEGKAVYGERLHIGYRWYDREGIEPRFAFGHGLGYTTFTVEPVDLRGTAGGDDASVTVEVTNTGNRTGGEVVQVYVEPPAGDPDRPPQHLAGFRRVDLEAGASERVTIELPARAFASWLDGGWVVPEGPYSVHVGRSSRDHRPAGTLHAG